MGTEHAEWHARGRSVFGVSAGKDAVRFGKAGVKELYNCLPGLPGKSEWVWIIQKEKGYKEVLKIFM